MTIQITRQGMRAKADQMLRAKAEFEEKQIAMLPGFLEPALVHYLLRHVAAAQMTLKREIDSNQQEFGKSLFTPLTEPAWFVFHLALNRPALFQLIAQITGCVTPENFFGRIHRSLPGTDQHIDWHNDLGDHRLIGLWVNISDSPWAGGLFQLREKSTERVIFELGGEADRTMAGDAFIFRISPELEHRSTPVASGGARTVGVGWFREQPSRSDFTKEVFLSFNHPNTAP